MCTIFILLHMFIFSLFIILETHCQIVLKSNENYRIVGGESANISSIPYQVSLQYLNNGNYSHTCGGSIIDMSHVLTAAHCVYVGDTLMKANELRVLAGTSNRLNNDSTGHVRNIQKIIAHGKYSTNNDIMEFDIAILKLSQNFTSSMTLQAISLRTIASVSGENCTVSGWGKTSTNGSLSENLMKVDLPIFNHLSCRKNYGIVVTENMICAGFAEGGKDSCQGDSGGPLVCNNSLAGIVIFGHLCGEKRFPGVYTEMANYVEWINGVVSGVDNHIQNKYFILTFLIYLFILK